MEHKSHKAGWPRWSTHPGRARYSNRAPLLRADQEHAKVLMLLEQAMAIHIACVDRADRDASNFEQALLG